MLVLKISPPPKKSDSIDVALGEGDHMQLKIPPPPKKKKEMQPYSMKIKCTFWANSAAAILEAVLCATKSLIGHKSQEIKFR